MRRYSMSGREAREKLLPKNRSDWSQIRKLCGVLTLVVIFIVTIFYIKDRRREDMDRHWQTAIAIIEDVRQRPVSRSESARGGAMLYDVEILVRYNSNGTELKRWIRVEQRPEVLAEAELQAFRWKGKQCFVRWKSSDPSWVIAEVS
jgi:hypothetical protein